MAQPHGLDAIGSHVCRDFGKDGFFVGTIVDFDFDGKGDSLYCVEYTDGDKEDLDQEEFNYAYALHLRREGWDTLDDDLSHSDGGGSGGDCDGGVYRPPKVCMLVFAPRLC